jgi:diguanylate cyclase (GGDEF)-like protein
LLRKSGVRAPKTQGEENIMASRVDEETLEAQSLSTSLDPYGQLVKMLMPRAVCIAIYDRMSIPLWLSDGYDGHDLGQLVEEALSSARSGNHDPEERDGFARSWDGETSYVFIIKDGTTLLGALAVSVQDGSNGARPFTMLQGLLRPALQVLGRELANQSNIGDLRKDLSARDGDLALLLDASGAADEHNDHDFAQLVRNCVSHMECAYGTLLVPDKKIAISHSADARIDAQLLDKTQRNLFAWAQVQRRTLLLNKAPPNSPLGALPYKILACPIRHGAHHVTGLLMLAKPIDAADFDVRQVRILEMMTRRIAYVLQNAYDPSTALLTRPAFEQRALTTLQTFGAESQHCVAYADVDRLHVVNENHGMHVGDEVIRRAAEVLRAQLPPNVVAARISGDRFAMFFPQSSLQAARSFVEGLCRTVAKETFKHDDKEIELSLSVGVASVPSTKFPLSHALAAAEIACKAAKDRGRGRVEVYQEADRSIVRRYEDVTIVGDLREAIANDRFRMEAQPILDLATKGAPRRFELLLRMIDPAGESVAPDKFLSAAERYQLAADIDRWVVQYALEILASAAPALNSLGAHFAINISGQSLGDEEFPIFLEGKLREYDLPAKLLSFEITETAAVANIVRAEMLIRRLQDLGHCIALDDFGRGLSSLTYLKSLSVSHLKIDGELVRDLAGNARSQAMVTAIVQLAQAMKLKTTAECVESEGILSAVAKLGVDYGQGFAIGRPRPLEIVLQELLRGAPGIVRSAGSPRMARFAGM